MLFLFLLASFSNEYGTLRLLVDLIKEYRKWLSDTNASSVLQRRKNPFFLSKRMSKKSTQSRRFNNSSKAEAEEVAEILRNPVGRPNVYASMDPKAMVVKNLHPLESALRGGVNDDSTRKSYDSVVSTHLFAGFPLTFEGVRDHLLWQECRLKKGAAALLRTALSEHLLLSEQSLSPAQYAILERLIALRPGPDEPRGGIDAVMFATLLAYVRSFGHRNMVRRDRQWMAIFVTWVTGLRGCQVESLKKEHFYQEGGIWKVRVERRHDPNQRMRNKYVEISIPTHSDPEYQRILTEHLDNLDPSDYVCPEFNSRELNALIHRCRDSAGWSSEVKIDGIHCLRHGAIAEARRVGGLQAAVLQSGHSFVPRPVMSEHYATTNAEKVHGTTATLAKERADLTLQVRQEALQKRHEKLFSTKTASKRAVLARKKLRAGRKVVGKSPATKKVAKKGTMHRKGNSRS